MSTKWNNNLKLQKTPKVCKKVPPPGWPDDQFRYFPLQAYAMWYDPQTPLEQSLSGYTSLTPYPSLDVHEGQIIGDSALLNIHLQWDPFMVQFVYTVSLYINSIFTKAVDVTFSDPTAALPFMAGLFTWQWPGNPEIIQSKVYS